MKFPNHFNFTQPDTPVTPFEKFFKHKFKKKIWLKRDDLTGLELSGNKVRKLDFLLARAVNEGCDHLITCGGIQSNHCRTTAFYAAKLGLKSTLVLKGEVPDKLEGNFLLNTLAGAEIKFVTPEEYKNVETIMDQIATNHSGKSFIIPEGGSNETGAWGYLKCFLEIQRQFENMQQPLDTIVFATGSGGTHAGLLAAKLLQKSRINIISVNVCDNAVFFKNKITSIINTLAKNYHMDIKCAETDVHIIDGFAGAGYGVVSEKEIEIISRLAKTEGILIDPVYGAKALYGFETSLEKGKIPGEHILFIHTGGVFGLFPYGQYFE
jgi:D-cysteine desulfhydrase